MAYRYSDMGHDGCSCLSEDARCHKCNHILTEDEGLFCVDCENEMKAEQDIETNFLLDELGEFVTNL